jgi:cell division protein FtsB
MGLLYVWNFITSHWKLFLIVVLAVVLLFWINSKAQLSSRLWKMVVTEIKDDQKWIEEDLVKEINRLDGEREQLLKKIALLQTDKAKLKDQNALLDTAKCALEAKLTSLFVPTAVPDIVIGLREQGLGSARARNLP